MKLNFFLAMLWSTTINNEYVRTSYQIQKKM